MSMFSSDFPELISKDYGKKKKKSKKRPKCKKTRDKKKGKK